MIAGVPSHRRKQRLLPRFAGTLSLVLLGTATAMAAPSEQLVGRWYSEGVENGTYLQLIDDRRTDGTFTLVLRTSYRAKRRGRGKRPDRGTTPTAR
jgi:hypothetical protein